MVKRLSELSDQSAATLKRICQDNECKSEQFSDAGLGSDCSEDEDTIDQDEDTEASYEGIACEMYMLLRKTCCVDCTTAISCPCEDLF